MPESSAECLSVCHAFNKLQEMTSGLGKTSIPDSANEGKYSPFDVQPTTKKFLILTQPRKNGGNESNDNSSFIRFPLEKISVEIQILKDIILKCKTSVFCATRCLKFTEKV